MAAHMSGRGGLEVNRHRLSTLSHPMIDDAHYLPRRPGALGRQPKPTDERETAFLDFGQGARPRLVEAAAAGAGRVNAKMGKALTLARLHDPERVDWALDTSAIFGRFAHGDLAAILPSRPPQTRRRAGESHSLQLDETVMATGCA